MKVVSLVLLLGWSTVVSAQPVPPGRMDVSVGGHWSGSTAAGSRDATLTRPDDEPFRLFSTTTEEGQAIAVEGRLGVRLTDTLYLEGGVAYSHRDLLARITADTEAVADVTVTERITEVAVDVGFVEYLSRVTVGGRIVPFASLGGGVARQLHDGRTLGETAGFGYFGGGLAVLAFTWPDAGLKAVGFRVEARARLRKGGVLLDEDTHVSPEAGASIMLRF